MRLTFADWGGGQGLRGHAVMIALGLAGSQFNWNLTLNIAISQNIAAGVVGDGFKVAIYFVAARNRFYWATGSFNARN